MKTNEQYNYMFENQGEQILGPVAAASWRRDPKRLLFTLSRYKFVSKMLQGKRRVLEVGCGDAWASRIVAQHVNSLTAIDIDDRFIQSARRRSDDGWFIHLSTSDISTFCSQEKYDAIYLLDVFEHIDKSKEHDFILSIKKHLDDTGVVLIGCPSKHSQDFIPFDKRDPGHVNCKSGQELRYFLNEHFSNVFIFSMNDEAIHTGNENMAHYFLCMCCAPKKNY